ncbi:putative SAM dependent methyltransferase [Cladophialophora carrionii]|uniref:Putative SAM dependent methyltransferase n=1 Tax=Cladophialophora carrionii TaxID=86049 RepID=A0A1C1CPE0_9EURO|nr:putative SAM dependent methyltransferase [Cladophialophora carrionii]
MCPEGDDVDDSQSERSSRITADPGIADDDSAYGDDASTETTSISSWIRDYRIENGRTYHAFKDGKYWGANDEEAIQHHDIGHNLYLKTLQNRLFIAPIGPDPSEILDLGTGSGLWAIEVADMYPSAIVTGTDLSPIQPTWVPPNVRFEIDDMESEWTFEPNTFDLIHIRGLHGTIDDWPTLYQQCMRCLKPGGWLEQAEYSAQFTSDDNTIPPAGGIVVWNAVGPECHAKLNRELQVLESMRGHMIRAGFESVTEQRYKWPIGPWPKDPALKELGSWCRAHIETGLENWTLRLLTSVLGWTADEVRVLCANVRAEIRNPKVHAIHRMNVVYARKPGGN